MRDLGQRHHNLGDLVAAEIRAAILSGSLQPGERLKQTQLAESLNVSRIPVREALRILEAEGLIESSPGKGSRVVALTSISAEEVLTVRGTLEGLAAGLAAGRITEGEVASLRSIIDAGRRATSHGDHTVATDLHTEFHLELARASGNAHLYDELFAMPAKTEWITGTLLKARGTYSWSEHEEILDAVADGEADRAEDLMRNHAESVLTTLLEDTRSTP